ncbi:MAG TPA: dTDP-4-dehydrorhamnose 3,5-epimerase [Stellaceae bacterium]|jgi:dTDP-4-dehydrorhamnose 3,5-epimerase|nr:dTDP-4-dehydrorhamnose 3,5-epimerase [Stellaceae bacterium]
MIFTPARLAGLMLVELEPHRDERGWFARAWCAREFAEHGLDPGLAQASLSFNHRRGTLRGLHYQRPPHAEAKLVRCLSGALWDVAVDLRPGSPTRGRWEAFELSAANRRALYIPAGFAHGFQTLAPDTEILYLISAFHAPEAAAGLRHDDPAFAISWPLPVAAISPRDTAWPAFAADVEKLPT